ncbi:hypothetical protein DSO57_1012496 [Entomophthora muscae]|uniref:Uncharacterized protein n=1 Tax=Entomophthora muscae TaxID=34485 RepID=A0ACC2SIY9_9FUNG|nr:hypothetical protein DSO57_1012496 [Entomophthora muscae]
MPFYTAYMFVKGTLLVLLVTMSCLIVTLSQLLVFPLYWISPKWNYMFQSYSLGRQIRVMQFVFEELNSGKVTYSGDKVVPGESALLISNHQSGSDFYMIGALSRHVGMEPYNRYFLKDSIKYLPIFGWSLYLIGMLFIKRNWLSDHKKIDKVFHTFLHNRLPVWLITYPEGTRFTQKKKQESDEFCKSRNLEPFKNVMYPRVKGTVSSIKKLRHSHVRHLYDITMAYSSKRPNGFRKNPNPFEIHYHEQLSPNYRFHIHVDKFLLEDLPTDDQELADWIVERFRVKDKFLETLKAKSWVDNLDPKYKVRDCPN